MDISTLGKGALVGKESLKDYRLEAIPGSVVLPKNYELVYQGKIKNQNGSSSCVSQATSYYAEVLNWLETKEWTELSPKFLYAQCFISLGGSYIKDNFNLMVGDGIAPEAVLPSYDALQAPSEAFMERKADITQPVLDSATPYLAKSYYTWDNTSIDLYKQAIVQGNGCIVASWGNNQCWATGDIQVPAFKEQMVWMHGIYLIGYNDDTKMFKFINSWSDQWGHGGYGYLPYEYATKGYLSNPMTLIDESNNTYGLMQKLVSLLKNLIELLTKK